MAKKYYWLKLQKDFFSQPKIKKLRKIAGGDTFTIIYLKMQLLSLKNDGILIFEGIEEDFAEEIALTIDEDVDNVKVTIQYLIAQKMITIINNTEFLLEETKLLIGSESDSANRVKAFRNRKKQELENTNKQNNSVTCNENVTQSVTQCNADVTSCNIEIEKEIELDIDKELDIELKKEKKEKEKTFKNLIASYTCNLELISSLNDFVEMRKKMKGFTTRALQLALNKLDSLANDDLTKIKIIEQSIENSWKSFYNLKNDKNNNNNWSFNDF